MNARMEARLLRHRLRVVGKPVKPRKPGTWYPLAKPVFAADNVALAFWQSRCPDHLRARFQLTDLRALAKAIRAYR